MTSSIELAFLLILIYQVKHFLADFVFQRSYMLRKTSPNWDFLLPLSIHCSVHAFLTALIVLPLVPGLWYLILVDFILHFVMDRIKSGPKYLGRFNDVDRQAFWNCFGFDQMVHHLTHLYIVWMIIKTLPPS